MRQEQCVFFHNMAAVANQRNKGVESLWSEWNNLLTLGQFSFSDVQVKWTELKQHM